MSLFNKNDMVFIINSGDYWNNRKNLNIDSFKVGSLFLYFGNIFEVIGIDKKYCCIDAKTESTIYTFYAEHHFDNIEMINDKLKSFI